MTTRTKLRKFLLGDPKKSGTQKFDSDEVIYRMNQTLTTQTKDSGSPYAKAIGHVIYKDSTTARKESRARKRAKCSKR